MVIYSHEYLDPATFGGLNLYAYCNNNPIMYVDPSGHFPFFLLTALLAVCFTAAVDYIPDQEFDLHWGWYVGSVVVGAVIGLGTSALLAGNFFANVSSVIKGVTLTYRMIKAGGLGATLLMFGDNLKNAFYNFTHVFWAGGDIAMNGGKYLANEIGGTTLEMTNLGQYLSNNPNYEVWKIASENFANQVSNGSSVFVMQNINGISITSIWATIEYPTIMNKSIDIIYEVIGGI